MARTLSDAEHDYSVGCASQKVEPTEALNCCFIWWAAILRDEYVAVGWLKTSRKITTLPVIYASWLCLRLALRR